jgi:glycosyltransferase involved in cell wall biosynthesis
MRRNRLLFYSQYAFFGRLYAVFQQLCADFGLDGYVITHEKTPVPQVYSRTGYLSPQSAGLQQVPSFVTVVPHDLSLPQKLALLKRRIREIRPDFIWAHEEPNEFYVNHILRWIYLWRSTRIVVPVVENVWPVDKSVAARLAWCRRKLFWRRYDGVMACATKSLEAVIRFGMPGRVPAQIAGLPISSPPPANGNGNVSYLPAKLPGEFVIGFVGRIMAAKGWRVLLAALTLLPENFKCWIAGGGEEEAELRLWSFLPEIRSRLHYAGLLDGDQIWNFYRHLDLLVLPSLTTPQWMEQFGHVLAEAMACGVPLIGSSSGSIPEVIGDCGMVFEEGNPTALAQAIQSMASDAHRRTAYAERGRRRFNEEYSYKAYAGKIGAVFGLKPAGTTVTSGSK